MFECCLCSRKPPQLSLQKVEDVMIFNDVITIIKNDFISSHIHLKFIKIYNFFIFFFHKINSFSEIVSGKMVCVFKLLMLTENIFYQRVQKVIFHVKTSDENLMGTTTMEVM